MRRGARLITDAVELAPVVHAGHAGEVIRGHAAINASVSGVVVFISGSVVAVSVVDFTIITISYFVIFAVVVSLQDGDVRAGPEVLLGPAAEGAGAVGTGAPAVARRIRPLEYKWIECIGCNKCATHPALFSRSVEVDFIDLAVLLHNCTA